ncbi:MAG: tyrosine-protein phosphatase [Clostridia bacterium]|nr:tyrosine-protein phosphatase [Clostridia bacterium]
MKKRFSWAKRLLTLILVLTLIPAVPAVMAAEGEENPDIQYADFHTIDQAEFLKDTLSSISSYAKGSGEKSYPNAVWCDFSGEGLGESSEYFFELSEKPDFSDSRVYELRRIRNQQYQLYNLEAGAHVYWRVALEKEDLPGRPVHEIIVTSGAPRNLFIYGISNMRDLGGWKSSLGENAYIRQGLVFRGGAPNDVLKTGEEQMRDLGIKVEIDLRLKSYDEDLDNKPGPYIEGVDYFYLTLGQHANPEGPEESYREIFRLISEADVNPVYYHCHAGADRTGITSFYLLLMCGVSFEDAARDYLFTNFSIYGSRALENGPEKWTQHIRGLEGDTLAEKAKQWAVSMGIPEETVEKIRRTLIENYDPDFKTENEVDPSDWAAEEVDSAIDHGLVPYELRVGYKDPISRGSVAGMVVNLLQTASNKRIDAFLSERDIARPGDSGYTFPFSDTRDANISAANGLGIINGVGKGLFNVNGILTRAQAAALINRVAGVMGVDTSGYTHNFTDITGNNKWVDSELGWLVENGIIKGVSDTRFNPGGTLTKEQAILIFNRAAAVLSTGSGRRSATAGSTPEAGSDSYITRFFSEDEIAVYMPCDDVTAPSAFGSFSVTANGDLDASGGYLGGGAEVDDGYYTVEGFDPGMSSFSVSFWVSVDKLDGDPALVSNKDWDSGNNEGFVLSLREKDITFNFGDGDNRMDERWDLPYDTLDGWMHVTFIVNREANLVGLAYDFGPVDFRPLSDELAGTAISSPEKFNIGQDGTGEYGDSPEAVMDEIIIFSRALTDSDLGTLAAYYAGAAD